jgi:Fic family protein
LDDADNDPESLKLDAEVRAENNRVNAKDLRMYDYNHSQKGKARQQKYEQTQSRKTMQSAYRRNIWSKREERNKGYCYGIIVNQKGITISEIAKLLKTDNQHVCKYITELVSEHMIELKT